jgi:cell division protein FtsQ
MQNAAQKKNRKRRSVKAFLIILMIFLILGVIGTSAYFICRVKTVEVHGNTRFSSEQIVAMSAIKQGDSIFTLKNAEIKSLLLKDPYIRTADIEVKLPDTVLLKISENTACAMILYMDSFIILDDEGIILEITSNVAKEFAPVVSGMNVTAFKVGQKIQSADDQQLICYQTLMKKLKEYMALGNMSEINLSSTGAIMLVSKDGLRIRIGAMIEIDKKLKWVSAVLPILIGQGKTSGVLDVSNPDHASYIP